MNRTKFTAALMAAAVALTSIPFSAFAQDIPQAEEVRVVKELGWYDESVSSEAVTEDAYYYESEEVYETEEAEEPELFLWESTTTAYNSAGLGWSYVDGAAKYRVYKYSPSKGKFVKYKDVTGTTVSVTGLKAKKTYTFYVSALDPSGKVIVNSPELTVTTPAKPSTKLSAPTGLTSTAKTQKSVTLKWNKVSGADGYRIYKYSTSKGKFLKYKDVTKTTLKVTGLKAGTSYKFMVASLVKKNGKYVVQNKSAEYTVATSAKSSSSSSKPKDGTSVEPGKWNDPDLGASLSSVIKTCGIGYYTISDDDSLKNGKNYSGLTYYGGELSGASLFFNSQNELYQYILTIPCTYSTFSNILSIAKKGYSYDYDYYDGYYFFGSSLYQLVLHYSNDGYMSWMVYSSYYEY